jgi:hypothetical protein
VLCKVWRIRSKLQYDLWNDVPSDRWDWKLLKERIANQVWVAQFLIVRTHAYRIDCANIWSQSQRMLANKLKQESFSQQQEQQLHDKEIKR